MVWLHYKEQFMRLKIIENILKNQPTSDIQRILTYRTSFFGQPFSACLQTILRGESDWSIGERELFASFTADRLKCVF
jgi:hypothetical protein